MKLTRILLCTAIIAIVIFGGACSPKSDEVSYEPDLTAGYRATVLYYKDTNGYIVPVVKRIPWEEGIGKAALSLLVDNETNREYLKPLGLSATVPEGTEFSLSISEDGVASVDLKGLSACADAAAERDMISSIVNTLVEFPAIESVSITVAGQDNVALPHETVLKNAFHGGALNPEDGELAVSADGASPVTLYFPNTSASLTVPVTRYIKGNATVSGVIEELTKGPEGNGLRACFPEGTKVTNVNISSGRAAVELSNEFLQAANVDGLAQAAYESIFYTLNAIEHIAALDIYVDGELCELTSGISEPVYMNEF